MIAAVFCMGGRGHVQRLRPIISGLAAAGVDTRVFTGLAYRAEVERAGGTFVDLFAGRPLASADRTSIPLPSRYVTFAGRYGEDIVREVSRLGPSIVVHDTFAVVGVVVAHHLGIPRVNICAGHNQAPEPTLRSLNSDPRVTISDECREAVRILRERHGMPDATPFAYVTTVSPHLNVYCEPPQFLKDDERAPFEPIAFFGSLSSDDFTADATSPSLFDPGGTNCVYVSFGTVIWTYFEAEALSLIETISATLSATSNTRTVVSLGNRGPFDRARLMARPNVRIERYVDQWRALRGATLSVTHQGLNSTHEAIYHRTPMISYPFFGDQPALAKRCQELGVAVPLVPEVRQPVRPEHLQAALNRIFNCREVMAARLEEARRWELETIAARPAVVARMLALAR